MTAIATRLGGWRSNAPWATVGLTASVPVGLIAGTSPRAALVVAMAAVAGAVAIRWPHLVLVLALPGNLAYWRVGGSGLDLSLADAAIALGTLAALPHLPWRSRTLHVFQRIYAVYAAMLLITVVAHPSRVAVISFVQRAVMVLGAVAIGAAIGAKGQVPAALRVLYGSTMVVGIAAMWDSFQHEFQPAYPFGMHKNLVGAVLSMTLVLSFALGRADGLPDAQRWAAQAIMIGGLVASQARGATLSVVVALAVAAIRKPRLLQSPW